MKDIDPHALGGPTDETIVERLARAVDIRRIGPATPGLQHVNNAADHPPVVDARLAPRVLRQQRLKPRELFLGQPEMIANHRQSPFGDRESQTQARGNPLYGSRP